jgi:hypothetical protein
MIHIRDKRFMICVMMVIISSLVLSCGSLYAERIYKQNTLLFPMDVSEELKANVSADFGKAVSASLSEALASNTKYAIYLYTERLSPIKRGLEDKTLKQDDIAAPFSDDIAKTLKLVRLFNPEVFIAGSIDSSVINMTDKTSTINISGALYDARTGKPMFIWSVIGQSPQGAVATTEDELRSLAAADAVVKIKQEIYRNANIDQPKPPKAKKVKRK